MNTLPPSLTDMLTGGDLDAESSTHVLKLATMYQRYFNEQVTDFTALKGDASDRRIFRIAGEGHRAIGIIGPHLEENRAFIGFARSFRSAGLSVPEIYSVSRDEHLYLEEDLGDVTLASWQEALPASGWREEMQTMYTRVLKELLRFQYDAAGKIDYSLCYQSTAFDAAAMLRDVDYFRDHVLERLLVIDWDTAGFVRDTRKLIDLLAGTARNAFLYRDFQSRNIMIREGSPCFIDFQSGRRGAPHYDVAALLYDSRNRLDEADRMLLVSRYCEMLREKTPATSRDYDHPGFLYLFHGFVVLRLMQALGAFANLGLNKGKPAFLQLIPSRLQALRELLREAEIMRKLPVLRELLLTLAVDPASLSIPEGHS
ncbi:MAG: phosphotransferase [Bacteroidetes bacterium]|nr:phosphotransferase [Bacteroidota bacterium]